MGEKISYKEEAGIREKMKYAVLITLLSFAAATAQVPAKALHLRVVDGRNGRAVQNEDIKLWYDEQQGGPILLRTNAEGVVDVPPPLSAAVRVLVQPVESFDCRKPKPDDPLHAYSLKQIAETGLATENHCGSPIVRRQAGELVLFVRDRRWYDGFNQ